MFEVNLPFIFIYSSFCHIGYYWLWYSTGYQAFFALNMKRHSAHLLESTALWCVQRNFVLSVGDSKSFLQCVVFFFLTQESDTKILDLSLFLFNK